MSGADLARFAADLTKAAAGIESVAESRAKRTAESAAGMARSVAPVDTGETRASIDVVKVKDGYAVEATTRASVFQEWGTSTMAPNPFIGPAVDRFAPDLDLIADDIMRRLG